MISVRREWLACKTDEQRLAWANKWGDLLMEKQQNPIWTSGHTQGMKEANEILRRLAKGEDPKTRISNEMMAYAHALRIMHSSVKLATFDITVNSRDVDNIDEEDLIKTAGEMMAPIIAKHLFIETEVLEDGSVKYIYSLVMIDD